MADHDTEYQSARKRVEARLGFVSHLGVYVIINVIFLIVVGWDFLWVTAFWGMGVLLQAWAVFFADSGRVRAWKEQQIAREVARARGEPPAATQPTEPTASTTPEGAPTQPIEE